MPKFEVVKNYPDRALSEEYTEVIEAVNIGVSNGVLYLMGEKGNVAIFGRDYWQRVVKLEDD